MIYSDEGKLEKLLIVSDFSGSYNVLCTIRDLNSLSSKFSSDIINFERVQNFKKNTIYGTNKISLIEYCDPVYCEIVIHSKIHPLIILLASDVLRFHYLLFLRQKTS